MRIVLHRRKEPPGPACAEEMGEIQFAVIGLAAKDRQEVRGIILGKACRHPRRHLRIAAQGEDFGPPRRIADIGRTARALADTVRQMAKPEARAVALHGIQPGALDELIEPGRARRARARCRVERGFDPRLGKQEFEIHPGLTRGIGDRAFD